MPHPESGLAFTWGDQMGNPGKCLFVLSTGRCGTMTLAKLLSQHPLIVGLHEPFPRLVRLSGEAYHDPKGVWVRFAIAVARRDLISEVNRQGRIYAETANRLTFFAYGIERVFPDSKFVHLVRHPFNVIDSGIRRRWYAGHPWDEGRIVPSQKDHSINWNSLSHSKKVAWNWVETNRFIIQFFKSLPPERKFFLRLEDLRVKLNALWEFIGVPPVPVSVERANVGPRTPVERDYTAFLRAIGGDIVEALGYSLLEEGHTSVNEKAF